jgi:uncharacterized membrane protein
VVRALRHLFLPDWWARRPFPPRVLERVGRAISGSERLHRGEICFAVEGGLPLGALREGCRARARELFGLLGVWDTEENTGVLIYVQLIDHDIEIVADRGIAARVPQREWEEVCHAMEAAFRAKRFEEGTIQAIERVTLLLAQNFPAEGVSANEIPDKPRVL